MAADVTSSPAFHARTPPLLSQAPRASNNGLVWDASSDGSPIVAKAGSLPMAWSRAQRLALYRSRLLLSRDPHIPWRDDFRLFDASLRGEGDASDPGAYGRCGSVEFPATASAGQQHAARRTSFEHLLFCRVDAVNKPGHRPDNDEIGRQRSIILRRKSIRSQHDQTGGSVVVMIISLCSRAQNNAQTSEFRRRPVPSRSFRWARGSRARANSDPEIRLEP